MSSSTAILSQGVGYGIVIGMGLFFTVLMIGLTWVQQRYTNFKISNIAEFSSASHSVKPALIGELQHPTVFLAEGAMLCICSNTASWKA